VKKILVVAVISLIAGALGFAFYSNSKQKAEAEQAAATAEQAAANAEPGPRPMATVLPEFSLKNRAGEMQSIKSWPGKSLIINFWATWCGPCRREIPLLMDIQAKRAKDGFEVVGIAIDFHEEVIKYADQMKINYPLLIGEQDGMAAGDSFGIDASGLPFTVFTAQDGRIVTIKIGELTAPMAAIILRTVEQVNRGELTPDAARSQIAMELMALAPEKPATG